MKSPTLATSSFSPWYCCGSSLVTGRLYPVETGSINTKSVRSSQVDSLSASWYGGGGASPSSVRFALRGATEAMCNQTDDEPGPPLKAKVNGRVAGSPVSSSV